MALKRTSDSRFKNQVQSGEQAWSFISLSLSQSQDPVMRHTSPQSRESASRHDVLKGFLLTREFITKSLEFQTTSNWLSWPLLQHSSLSPTFTKYFLNDYLCRWRLQFVQHWLFDEISQLFTQNFSEQNWYQLCDLVWWRVSWSHVHSASTNIQLTGASHATTGGTNIIGDSARDTHTQHILMRN